MKKLYTIYPASAAETNEGWVWFKDPDLPSRTIVKIQNVTTGHFVFCESRRIDAYFLENCKETRGFKPENPDDALFISGWYRDALGGFDPTSHSKKTVELSVTPVKGWLWNSLRAASHHPDFVARLGTRLGVTGVFLGIVALAPILLELPKWPKLVALSVSAVALAVGAYAFRGVNRPRRGKSPDWMTIFTGILALFAALSFGALWIQLQDARANFVKDQRPYVWQSAVKPLPFQLAQRIFVNFYFVNYGKSPALQFMGKGKVFFGEHALDEADRWFDSIGNDRLKIEGGSVTVIPPTISTDPEKTPVFTTVVSDSIPSAPEISYILSHDFAIVAVARGQYEDTSGNVYQTDLCFFRFQNNSVGQCEKHNTMR